jgi:hypothetical protein
LGATFAFDLTVVLLALLATAFALAAFLLAAAAAFSSFVEDLAALRLL